MVDHHVGVMKEDIFMSGAGHARRCSLDIHQVFSTEK